MSKTIEELIRENESDFDKEALMLMAAGLLEIAVRLDEPGDKEKIVGQMGSQLP